MPPRVAKKLRSTVRAYVVELRQEKYESGSSLSDQFIAKRSLRIRKGQKLVDVERMSAA